MTTNLRDPTKPKILPTFDVRYPVDSTPTMALTYPKKYENDINPETWNTDITNLEDANQQDLNGFLVYRMVHYKDSKYEDTILWYCIKED